MSMDMRLTLIYRTKEDSGEWGHTHQVSALEVGGRVTLVQDATPTGREFLTMHVHEGEHAFDALPFAVTVRAVMGECEVNGKLLVSSREDNTKVVGKTIALEITVLPGSMAVLIISFDRPRQRVTAPESGDEPDGQ